MSEMEWTLLHEATHINNNDLVSSLILLAGVTGSLELAYQKYKTLKPLAPVVIPTTWAQSAWKLTKSLPKRAVICTTMFTITNLAFKGYSRHIETRADAFANQHADIHALKAASNYFENIDYTDDREETIFSSLCRSHPTDKSRAQSIKNEIKRREINN